MSELAVGDIVGAVRIEEVIGYGQSCTVYRGCQLESGRAVALKVVNTDVAESEGFRERFEKEVAITTTLNHPNLVPIYSAGEEAGRWYIVMQYADGLNVREMARRGRITQAVMVKIICQAGEALDAARRLGSARRVSSANVVMTLEKPRSRGYLTGLGLSTPATSPAEPGAALPTARPMFGHWDWFSTRA